MLKLLYKTLLISLLSCSLMVMDFNSKGLNFNSVQAETLRTEKALDGDMMTSLTMTGIGLLTSRLYACKMTTDMMIAAAGGAAFVAGEILSTLQLRQVMKDLETEITRDKKGNINREQIASLERLKKSYEEARETAGTKKMLQMASAAAFLAAAAVAYSMYAAHQASESACTASLASAGPSCSTEAATFAAAQQYQRSAMAATGGTSMIGSIAATLKGWISQITPGPSAAKEAEALATDAANEATQSTAASQCISAMNGSMVCKSSYVLKANGKGVCMTPPGLVNVPNSLGAAKYASMMSPVNKPSSLASIFQSVFISNAQADLFSPMGIASSVAISYLLETSATLGLKIDTYLYSPMNRAIIWGVLAGLAFAASSSTDNVMSKIDANISKIDAILNHMNSMAAGTKATQVIQNKAIQTTSRPNSQLEFNSTDYGEIDLAKNGTGSLPCFTGPQVGKTCKSFTEANKDLPSFQSLNVESQKQVSSILSMANGLNGTSKIGKATLSNAATLAGSASALKTKVDEAKKKLSDSLKASDSKLSISDREKTFSSDIEKAMRDGLKKRNMSAANMVSSLYGGSAAKGSGTSSATAGTEAKETVKAITPTANVIDMSAGSADTEGMDIGLTGVSEPDKELSPAELAALNAEQKAVAGAALEEYDLKNDISPDNSSSLFDLISNRYQKSGYPRLFKVKEPQTPAPVTK